MKNLIYTFVTALLLTACGSPGEKEKQIREEERTPAYSSQPDSLQMNDSIPMNDDTVRRDSL